MKKTTKIKNLGMVNLVGTSIEDGRLEVHIPIDVTAQTLDRILDHCTKDYIRKYNNVESQEELNYDVRVACSCGGFKADSGEGMEFTLFIIVWQRSDAETEKDTAEFYGDIPVCFDEEDTEKMKSIVWDALSKTFFNLQQVVANQL